MKKIIMRCLLLAAMLCLMALPARAASRKTISTVTLKAISSLEAGDSMEDAYDKVEINVSDSAHYYVEDFSITSSGSRMINVGDEVKIKASVYILDDDYMFSSSTHVSVSGGTYVSHSRSSSNHMTVTLKLRPVGGQFEEPWDVHWASSPLGTLSWSEPDITSGYYGIILYHGNSKVTSITEYKGHKINLYPWMTRQGDYTVKIRTVPAPNTSTSGVKNSEWTESDYLYISEKKVSDGSGKEAVINGSGSGSGSGSVPGGQPGTPGYQVGWVLQNGTWYYRYPNGTFRTNGWEKINGKWYYFTSTGAMATGWQQIGGQYYYLDVTNGDMKTGWVNAEGTWYYLNESTTSGIEGAMFRDQWLDWQGHRYYLMSNGAMAVNWNTIGNKYYYFNPNPGGPMGALVTNTWIGTFFVGPDGAWIQNY